MVEFITAFDLLSSRRTGGFGANPISLTDIFAYYKMYEVPINLQTFVKIICKMDSEFLEFHRKKKA